MESKLYKPISCFKSSFEYIPCIDRNGRNLQNLRQAAGYLYDMRDVIEGEFLKKSMQGIFVYKECQIWLRKVAETEHHVNELLKAYTESSNCSMVTRYRLRSRLKFVLAEVTYLLENPPFDLRSLSLGLDGINNKLTAPITKSESQKSVKKTVGTKKGKAVSTGGESTAKSGMSSIFGQKFVKERMAQIRCPDEKYSAASLVEGKTLDEIVEVREEIRSTQIDDPYDYACTGMEDDAKITFSKISGRKRNTDTPLFGEWSEENPTLMFTKSKLPSFSQAAEIVESASDSNRKTVPIQETNIKSLSFPTTEQPISNTHKLIESAANLIRTTDSCNKPQIMTEPSSMNIEESGTDVIEIEVSDQFGERHDRPDIEENAKRSVVDAVLKILRYLNSVEVRRVGIHGIGGIGKTTVLNALISHQEVKCMFELIIWVNVTRQWSRRKIQAEISRQIAVNINGSETDADVAVVLLQKLKSKKFLLVLDDVWKEINLDTIGIPEPSSENGCRIILSTRFLDVCHVMSADRNIGLEFLRHKEAWELFRAEAGEIVDSPVIRPFAQATVECCNGLPLLLVATGRALMKASHISVWKHALREFLFCSELGDQSILQKLKLSYDMLDSPDTKNCFLYCALFPEDREVDVSELICCCIQDGLICGSSTDGLKRGQAIVEYLIAAALLQRARDGLSIKMHDLVRDLAYAVLSSKADSCFRVTAYSRYREPSEMEEHLSYRKSSRLLGLEIPKLLLSAGTGLADSPSIEEWGRAQMISLMNNQLCTLPESPDCPILLSLFLQRNYNLRVISASFFNRMPSLRILNLSNTKIKSLPESLFKVSSLQMIILRECQHLYTLPSEVGCLKHLEVLDLFSTEINNLPREVGELSSLKYLDVSFFGSVNYKEHSRLPVELVPTDIFSNLIGLETLHLSIYPGDRRWGSGAYSIIRELSNLGKLVDLNCCFPEVESLKYFLQTSEAWNSQSLTKFDFVVGHDAKRLVCRVPAYVESYYNQHDRCLRFVNGTTIPDEIIAVLACSSAFCLDHHLSIRTLLEFSTNNLNGLRLCILKECPSMETIIDSNGVGEPVFPFLERLSIHYLFELKRTWWGVIPIGSFGKLKSLSVHTCPKLRYVFTRSILHYFSSLQELIIEDCPAIEEIIYEDEAVDSNRNSLYSLKKLALHDLTCLSRIWQHYWPSLESLSIWNCPELRNIGIKPKSKHNIKEIEAEEDWFDELKWEDTSLFLDLKAHFIAIANR